MQYHRQAINLSLFFFFLLFLSGRIGLLLHEFAGHALIWRLMGGRLAGFKLFVFGGGRVQFEQMDSFSHLSVMQQLSVNLSGIAVELVVGIILMILAVILSKHLSIRALLASVAGVLVVHALFYLTLGLYYGSGDGILLYKLLQRGNRQIFLFFMFGFTIAAAFLISYLFSPMIKSWVVDCSSAQRNILIVVCAFMAAGLHGMLTLGERIAVNDTVYARIKSSENDRLKDAELSRFISDYMKEHGRRPDQEQIGNMEKALKKKYWQFPMDILLGIGIIAASLLGYFKSKRNEYEDSNPITWKDILQLGGSAGVMASLILILNQM